MKIANQTELVNRLMTGEKLRPVRGVVEYCFYDVKKAHTINHNGASPFRFGNEQKSFELDGFWLCADGETEWELVA